MLFLIQRTDHPSAHFSSCAIYLFPCFLDIAAAPTKKSLRFIMILSGNWISHRAIDRSTGVNQKATECFSLITFTAEILKKKNFIYSSPASEASSFIHTSLEKIITLQNNNLYLFIFILCFIALWLSCLFNNRINSNTFGIIESLNHLRVVYME